LPSLTVPFSYGLSNVDYEGNPKPWLYYKPMADLMGLLKEHEKRCSQAVDEHGWDEEGVQGWQEDFGKLQAKAVKWEEDIKSTKYGPKTVTYVYQAHLRAQVKALVPKIQEVPYYDGYTLSIRYANTMTGFDMHIGTS
ncbi:MAG: hypothetical protein Q9174_005687, partial [Haloplaca sp. 1 TL-2023]